MMFISFACPFYFFFVSLPDAFHVPRSSSFVRPHYIRNLLLISLLVAGFEDCFRAAFACASPFHTFSSYRAPSQRKHPAKEEKSIDFSSSFPSFCVNCPFDNIFPFTFLCFCRAAPSSSASLSLFHSVHESITNFPKAGCRHKKKSIIYEAMMKNS